MTKYEHFFWGIGGYIVKHEHLWPTASVPVVCLSVAFSYEHTLRLDTVINTRAMKKTTYF